MKTSLGNLVLPIRLSLTMREPYMVHGGPLSTVAIVSKLEIQPHIISTRTIVKVRVVTSNFHFSSCSTILRMLQLNIGDKCHQCLLKTALNDWCSTEALTGDTKGISRFCFWWFQPVWYYSPTASFPKDKMEPGFFLDLADNIGDRFAYAILPVKDVKDIPLGHNHTTLTRCVVRARDLTCPDVPLCQEECNGFHFYNVAGKEIFGSE